MAPRSNDHDHVRHPVFAIAALVITPVLRPMCVPARVPTCTWLIGNVSALFETCGVVWVGAHNSVRTLLQGGMLAIAARVVTPKLNAMRVPAIIAAPFARAEGRVPAVVEARPRRSRAHLAFRARGRGLVVLAVPTRIIAPVLCASLVKTCVTAVFPSWTLVGDVFTGLEGAAIRLWAHLTVTAGPTDFRRRARERKACQKRHDKL